MAAQSRWQDAARCAGIAVALVVAASGCVAPQPRSAAPPLQLQLLVAAELDLPADCRPVPGTMYRTRFEVRSDGSVSGIASEAGDGCVQQALRTWISTFGYAPVGEPQPVAFDWMLVTASRSD